MPFQSLLSWISPIGVANDVLGIVRRERFNPCCRGSRPSAGCAPGREAGAGVVSILVVVDLAHRLWLSPSLSVAMLSFNPCCRGSRPSAWHLLPDSGRPAVVSILVVVDLAHRRGSPFNERRAAAVFQSLLSWISPIGRRSQEGAGEARQLVSILVVVDLAHRPE